MKLIFNTVFFVLTLSSSLVHASDQVSKLDVDLLIARLQSSPFMDRMLAAKEEYFNASPKSADVMEFLHRCQDVTDTIISSFTNRPVDKLGDAFYRSDAAFTAVMGGSWRQSDDELYMRAWRAYYLEGGYFFVSTDDFDGALSMFLEADEIHKDSALIYIGGVSTSNLVDFESFNARVDVNDHERSQARRQYVRNLTHFVSIYEEIKKSREEELNKTDYGMLALFCGELGDHARTIIYANKYFDSLSDKHNDRNQKLAPTIFSHLVFAMVHTGKLQEAKKLLSGMTTTNALETSALWAHLYALEEDWSTSFAHFAQVVTNGCFFKGNDEHMLLPIITMLSKVSAADFNNAGVKFLQNIKERYPSLTKSIDVVMRDKKQETRHLRLVAAVKADLVDKIVTRALSSFQVADAAYQKIWKLSSRFEIDIEANFWEPIDSKARKLIDEFALIEAISRNQNVDQAYGQIKNLVEDFETKIESFLRDVKVAEHRLKERRRVELAFEQRAHSDAHQEFVVATQQNLRSQYLRERSSAQQSSATQMPHARGASTSTNATRVKRVSFVHAFRDRQIARLWKEDNLPSAALEILDCLQSATSIYEFRQNFTKPGAKLEVLKGKRAGQLSVRTNQQYRVCFNWTTGKGASAIEIVDYHR